MLVEFSVKNFRSIKDEQVLSLVKGSKDDHKFNFSETGAPSTPPILHSLAIYGANASGKTNIIKALLAMRNMVLHSASESQPGDELPVESYRLDGETYKSPTTFQVVFVSEKIRYVYGFITNKNKIIEEWLQAFPNGKSQTWFEREWNFETNEYDWYMGKSLLGNKNVWLNSTRSNALFLSTAVQLNSKMLTPVYDWFKNNLKISGISGWTDSFTSVMSQEEEGREKILKLMQSSGIDIQGLNVKKEKLTFESLPKEIPDEIKQEILKDHSDGEVINVKFAHKTSSGGIELFNKQDESDGTQKLFKLAGPWLDVLEKGYTIVIDELNNSLHPKLVNHLVGLFHNPQVNKKGAQLIFTSHETSIINQDFFRRDQIYFCENDQGSRLVSLLSYKPKKNRENLEAYYLSGRYGGVPFIPVIGEI